MTARNAGARATEALPIALTDTLPSKGLTVRSVHLVQVRPGFGQGVEEVTLEEGLCHFEGVSARCRFEGVLAPGEALKMEIAVTVNEPEAPGPLVNAATVSGGGPPAASTSEENHISPAPPAFGPQVFSTYMSGPAGERDTQAGGHPGAMTTVIGLNSAFGLPHNGTTNTLARSVQDVKDIVIDLPLGFAASTLAAPQCTFSQFNGQICPPDTRVGYITTEPLEVAAIHSAIFNLVPEKGVAGEFGFHEENNTFTLYGTVAPTPAGYVLRVTSHDISQIDLNRIVTTFFGDPAEADASGNAQVPFFTNPTDCSGGPVVTSLYVDSWQDPGSYNADGTPDVEGDPSAWVKATSSSPPVTGCNALSFTPELEAQPTTHQADTPSGLEFGLRLPQSEVAESPATPALKNATVMFPPGFTLDPSAGSGLEACSEAQVGWTGPTLFDFDAAPPQCPEASKIGSLELTTPLIPGTLYGEMYLATQNENPYKSTIGLYVVVQDPVTGVLLKIAGSAAADPRTGQITGVFDENAQLPFSELKLHFFGGPRAEFATPESCGTFTTTSVLEPWSFPDSGPAGSPFESFAIETGCVGGFAPAFAAGATNLQAGAYTTFVASFSRQDTDQEMGGLSVSLPPGLLANVGGVPLCGEAQANAGTCPESTQVGAVKAFAGPGPNPLFVGGKVYLTGPYNGGPYGLSVVVPALAGPFNFGQVVVRQSIRIDPTDAHVTDVSDPFPTILDVTGADGNTIGIPIRLRRVDVEIDRPGFTFNPTNCAKLHLGGSMTSTQGVSSTLATPFQVTNCATLKFAPKFAVSTSGKPSRANGASLAVKLTYPTAPSGTQANIARVKVELPKRLPSRLTTLQKACAATRFETNPASCPAASIVGHAKTSTPILSVPLEGPAYFVSHGGEAFPSLVMVLQGGGVTLDLVGSTFISKNGITSSTFKTVPDAPVGSFELTLPQGPYSALAANGNLCRQSLQMPTEFIAQNGAEIHQTTKITVTGCAKHKAKHTKKRTRHGRKRKKR